MAKRKIRVGQRVKVWWTTDRDDNMATVLAVLPYTGKFTQFYNCVLRLSAPNTYRGWMEMAYND